MDIKIREVILKDAENIFNFLFSQKRFGQEKKEQWLKKWKLLFEQNPLFGQGIVYPLGWIIEKNNGGIGGYLGNIVLPYFYNRKIYKAACITDVAVEPKLRSKSIALFKEYLKQKNVDLFINSTANENASRVFEGLKFFKLPAKNYNRMYYFFINPSVALRFFIGQRAPKIIAWPIAAIFGWLLKIFLLRRDKKLIETTVAKNEVVAEESFEKLDLAYDLFWQQIEKQNGRLMFLRTKEILKWHFNGTSAKNTKILCFRRNEKIIGYAIVEKRFEKRSGISRLRLIDILALNDQKEILNKLIVAAYLYGKRMGADLFECYFLPGVVRDCLYPLSHFIKKRAGGVYLRAIGPELEKIDLAKNWYATCIDGDSSF